MIRRYPNGGTHPSRWRGAFTESIGKCRAREEPKHPSTLRKRKYFPSSGERKGKSPNQLRVSVQALRSWGRKRRRGSLQGPQGNRPFRGKALGRPTGEGESPVPEKRRVPVDSLSTAGHANPAGNRGVQSLRLNIFGDR
jgi:hypothetical protein